MDGCAVRTRQSCHTAVGRHPLVDIASTPVSSMDHERGEPPCRRPIRSVRKQLEASWKVACPEVGESKRFGAAPTTKRKLYIIVTLLPRKKQERPVVIVPFQAQCNGIPNPCAFRIHPSIKSPRFDGAREVSVSLSPSTPINGWRPRTM
jgi:hypothetical protein